MKRLFLALAILLLLSVVPIVSADTSNDQPQQQTIGTVKQYQCLTISQLCANCTFVNITSITYVPTSIEVLGPTAMSVYSQTEYRYNMCNTTLLGRHIIKGAANSYGVLAPWTYDYEVTPSGFDLGISTLLIFALGAFIVLMFGMYIQNYYMGFISGILFLLLGIYTMIYGVSNLNDVYTQGIAITAIGLGIFLTIVSAYEWVLNESGEE